MTVASATAREAAAVEECERLRKENARVRSELDSQTSEWPARLRDEERRRAALEEKCSMLEELLEVTVRHLEDNIQMMDATPPRVASAGGLNWDDDDSVAGVLKP